MRLDDWLLEVLRCPECRERVRVSETSGVVCTGCGREYPEEDGILHMLPGDSGPGEEG